MTTTLKIPHHKENTVRINKSSNCRIQNQHKSIAFLYTNNELSERKLGKQSDLQWHQKKTI